MANDKILLVDDDKDILEFLRYNLENEGFIIEESQNGTDAVKKAAIFKPDLIIMDIMMPEMDGIEACEMIRSNEKLKDTLIVFLTARNEDYSKIAGYTAGADDYITKPIKPKLLILKIKALLKRKKTEDDKISEKIKLKQGNNKNIYIDREKYVVVKDNREIDLPRKEFELLVFLASKPDKIFTREEIFKNIWGYDTFISDRTIDVHIRKIRARLGNDIIKTVKGVGYKFVSKG